MKQDVKQLRDQLQKYRGAITEVVSRSGMSRETVRRVLAGEYVNTHVLATAAMVLKERKKSQPMMSTTEAQNLIRQAVA